MRGTFVRDEREIAFEIRWFDGSMKHFIKTIFLKKLVFFYCFLYLGGGKEFLFML